MQDILITGGAGFIGSHTAISLVKAGFRPVVIDNFVNSSPVAVERARELAGGADIPLIEGDLCDAAVVERVFSDYKIHAVIHFAGLKAVGESVGKPLEYYSNNLGSTLVVLETMRRHDCFNFIFSSSATVYGSPEVLPIPESHPLSATNPYGRSKLFIEEMLRDLALSDERWHLPLLRYFNPVGAHPSGRIGESPNDIPNNLFPCVTQFAVGRRPELKVFGTDYDTPDGSGVRDYLHVCDLADGHVAALREIGKLKGAVPINLGTGTGYSVLEVIAMFEEVSGKKIAAQMVERRPGDIASCYADATRAKELLNWEANQTLRSMCEDAWRWQTQNPKGYDS